MSQRILLVEDEAKIAAVLRDYLQAAGYAVRHVARGDAAVDAALSWPADLVLLDLMLPGEDGLSVCRRLRERSAVPVIMITAKVEEIDRILGLELGADDYICKPFSPREVVARVRAQLRRAALAAAPPSPPGSGLHLDTAFHRATLDGVALELTPVEFRLLRALAAMPGAVLSRRQLMDAAYDDHRVVSERTMDSHLKNLRRKLEASAAVSGPEGETPTIEGVYGVGYRLTLP